MESATSLAPDAVHFSSICVGALHSIGDEPEYENPFTVTDEPPPPLVVGVDAVVGDVGAVVGEGTLVVVELVAPGTVAGVVVEVVDWAFLWLLLHAASSTIPVTSTVRRTSGS